MSVKKIAGKKEQLERDIRDLRRKAGQATSMRLRQKMLAALAQLQEELAQLEKRKASVQQRRRGQGDAMSRTPATIKYHGQLYKRADATHYPMISDFEVDKWLQQNGLRLGTVLAKALLQALKQANKIMLIPPGDVQSLAQWLQWLLFTDPKRRTPPPTVLRGTPPNATPSFQLLSLLENVMGESLNKEMEDSGDAEGKETP